MSISADDVQFLRSVGCIVGEGEQWKVLCRQGRALLVVPCSLKDWHHAISLYRPQKRVAKLVAVALKILPVKFWPLSSIKLSWCPNQLLDKIAVAESHTIQAMLLGNPNQQERRVVVLTSDVNGKLRVIKLGCGEAAKQKIEHEITILEQVADVEQSMDVPECIDKWSADSWAAFAIPYYSAKADIRIERLCSMLTTWLDHTQVPLSQLPSWKTAIENSQNTPWHEKLKNLEADLMISPALRHGDLAPWNILSNDSGELVMIDWDQACLSDVPGWDLVHFLVIKAYLVDGMKAAEIGMLLLQQLEEDSDVRTYLRSCGWGDHVRLLVVSYLLFMGASLEIGNRMLGQLSEG